MQMIILKAAGFLSDYDESSSSMTFMPSPWGFPLPSLLAVSLPPTWWLEHGRLFWHALPLAFIASSRHVFQDHDVCITAWLSEPQQLEVSHVPIDWAVMVACGSLKFCGFPCRATFCGWWNLQPFVLRAKVRRAAHETWNFLMMIRGSGASNNVATSNKRYCTVINWHCLHL
jgi:hypothetical protein